MKTLIFIVTVLITTGIIMNILYPLDSVYNKDQYPQEFSFVHITDSKEQIINLNKGNAFIYTPFKSGYIQIIDPETRERIYMKVLPYKREDTFRVKKTKAYILQISDTEILNKFYIR